MSGSATRIVTVRIEGRVQGVYYRAWPEETARGLELDGWVRNVSDGSVEAAFAGPADKVETMLKLCQRGPADARVSKVIVTGEGGSVPGGFRVIGTDWQR